MLQIVVPDGFGPKFFQMELQSILLHLKEVFVSDVIRPELIQTWYRRLGYINIGYSLLVIDYLSQDLQTVCIELYKNK